MATTTNYGWDTPDDTDLVKDGASAIRTLGSSIDTTVFNNANAAIAKTIVDAKGDIIAATAADTVARLAVGANDTVLTADSSTATGLKWATAGVATDFTLLNAGGTALTGAATITVNITAYANLYVYIQGASSASASSVISVRFNSDSGANYRNNTVTYTNASSSPSYDGSDGATFDIGGMGSTAGSVVTAGIRVYGAKSSTGLKPVNYVGGGGTATSQKYVFGNGIYLGTSAITSVSILSSVGNFDAGTVYVYGAN